MAQTPALSSTHTYVVPLIQAEQKEKEQATSMSAT